MPNKSRKQLYQLFVTGSKPSQDDYMDLIDSMINQNDDGIGIGDQGEPMELLGKGTKQRFVDLSSAKDTPLWRIGARAGDNNGLNVATADDASRVFVKKENGFVGINNHDPQAKLHITPDSGVALRVDDSSHQTALVVGADGKLGLGADIQAQYDVSIGGSVNLMGETKFDSQIQAAHGIKVDGAELQVQQGLRVQKGLTVETGVVAANAGLNVNGTTLNANAGAIVSGVVLEAKKGLAVSEGAVVKSGPLEAKAGAIVSGARLEVENGLAVAGGATFKTGLLEAANGLAVANGMVIKTGKLEAQDGVTVKNGLAIESGGLTVDTGLTVNGGLVIETGQVNAQDGLVVNDGLVIESGQLKAAGGAVISGGALTANAGLVVQGKTALYDDTAIEQGVLTAKGGVSTAGSPLLATGEVTLGNSEAGAVNVAGALTAQNGLVVQNAALQAGAGAVISGSELKVENGLTVSKEATFTTGLLTAKAGLTVAEGSTFQVDGPAIIGTAKNGDVTINGGLVANHGMVVRGEQLVAETGMNIHGTLTASDDVAMGKVAIDTLEVNEISIKESLAISAFNPQHLTAKNIETDALTAWQETKLLGACTASDNFVFDSGMLYVTFEGDGSIRPKLKTIKGTVSGASGHFDFSVDTNKQVTIVYNDASDMAYFMEDWVKYQSANATLADGYYFARIGTSSWELCDSEYSLIQAAKPFQEYRSETQGFRIVYGGSLYDNPQFEIKENSDATKTDFTFKMEQQKLIINYPATESLRQVKILLSDWEVWRNKNLDASAEFEIRPTASLVPGLMVSAIETTQLIVNSAGARFNKTVIKTNTVTVNSFLKFGASDVLISGVSDSAALMENSADYLPTQKAVKTYVDTGLALKADTTAMKRELEKKVDTSALTTALEKKVDTSALTTALEKKVDTSALTTALEKKVDTSALTTALEKKADVTMLAAKAGLVCETAHAIAAGALATAGSIKLTNDSRGLLLLKLTTAAGKVAAGFFALHGTVSLIKIAGEGLTDQKDSSSVCNLYLSDGLVTVQNKLSEAVTITLTYFGI